MDIKIGQKVGFYKCVGGVGEAIEVTVNKIGEEYFKVLEFPNRRFYLSNGAERTANDTPNKVYQTMQEVRDVIEREKLKTRIMHGVDYYSLKSMPLDVLRQLNDVLTKYYREEYVQKEGR